MLEIDLKIDFMNFIDSKPYPNDNDTTYGYFYTYDTIQNQKKFNSKNDILNIHIEKIQNIISENNELLEGNCFYIHETLTKYDCLHTKQLNLFWCGSLVNKYICEIGFNAGHSCLLFLLGLNNFEKINFTIFDINNHIYTKPCFNYISENTDNNIEFEFIAGDSIITMPAWINLHQDLVGKYDVVHIDGGYYEECIKNDIYNSNILVRNGGIIIIDDTNSICINNYVEKMLDTGKYIELDILETQGYPHRIIQKISN